MKAVTLDALPRRSQGPVVRLVAKDMCLSEPADGVVLHEPDRDPVSQGLTACPSSPAVVSIGSLISDSAFLLNVEA